MTEDEQLDAAFSALAHPARRAILAHLSEGTASVNALAAPFDMTLPAVSKHIRVLEHAGLISREKDAQFRLCKLETASDPRNRKLDREVSVDLGGALRHVGHSFG